MQRHPPPRHSSVNRSWCSPRVRSVPSVTPSPSPSRAPWGPATAAVDTAAAASRRTTSRVVFGYVPRSFCFSHGRAHGPSVGDVTTRSGTADSIARSVIAPVPPGLQWVFRVIAPVLPGLQWVFPAPGLPWVFPPPPRPRLAPKPPSSTPALPLPGLLTALRSPLLPAPSPLPRRSRRSLSVAPTTSSLFLGFFWELLKIELLSGRRLLPPSPVGLWRSATGYTQEYTIERVLITDVVDSGPTTWTS